MQMKNPLVIFGIIGIIAGYILQGMTGNKEFLTYGMVAGLALGFLIDSKNRGTSSNPNKPSSGFDLSDLFNRPSSNQRPTDTYQKPEVQRPVSSPIEQEPVQEGGRSRVSRVDDAARAREEISKQTKDQ